MENKKSPNGPFGSGKYGPMFSVFLLSNFNT